jgi:hypothetical protein
VIGSVVAAALVAPVVVDAIAPSPMVVVHSIAPAMVLDLMLTLLVVGRVIAATARLGDGGNCDGAGRDQRGESLGVTRTHIPIPPV